MSSPSLLFLYMIIFSIAREIIINQLLWTSTKRIIYRKVYTNQTGKIINSTIMWTGFPKLSLYPAPCPSTVVVEWAVERGQMMRKMWKCRPNYDIVASCRNSDHSSHWHGHLATAITIYIFIPPYLTDRQYNDNFMCPILANTIILIAPSDYPYDDTSGT